MNHFFSHHSEVTDQVQTFVLDWISKNRPELPPLHLAPDFLLAPNLLFTPGKQDMQALAERCKKMFRVEMVVNLAKPPSANKKLILLAHEYWNFGECALGEHCLLLPVMHDDDAQTVLRQLIILLLSFAVGCGDLRNAKWLFQKRENGAYAPIYLMHRDHEFEGAVGALIHEWEEPPTYIPGKLMDDVQKLSEWPSVVIGGV